MKTFRLMAAVTTAAACCASLLVSPATADDSAQRPSGSPITVLADRLNGPFEISQTKKMMYVTESDAGRVIAINKKTKRARAVVTGLGPNTASGAVRVGSRIAIVTGEADPSAPAAPVPGSSVLVARPGGKPRQFADLMAYELKNNPDGQTQFGPNGQPLDALSNPFYVLKDKSKGGFVLVADGGANAVLRVDRRGRISTFFVPPTVNTGACEGLPNNDARTVGCDAVPTGLAYGPNNTLYVSALTAEVPGEGRVYVLNAKTGKLKRVITGFSGPTGVAVKKDTGTVYVSELLEGLPAGQPGPGFDPSTVGQLVKVARTGNRRFAQLPMPLGILIDGKRLYSTTWSIAGLFLGIPDAGQVVRVEDRAFGRSTGQDGVRIRSGIGDRLAIRSGR